MILFYNIGPKWPIIDIHSNNTDPSNQIAENQFHIYRNKIANGGIFLFLFRIPNKV